MIDFFGGNSSSLAMTLAFLCRPAVATSFLAGFVRNRVTVLSQTLQLAPRVLTLPRVRAGSGGLETYLGRPIKWAVPCTSLNYIALKLNFSKKENRKKKNPCLSCVTSSSTERKAYL